MLLIRRRVGESILIGEDIEIQVIEAGPHRVKLGIVAPSQISVVRREARLTREQNEAAAGTPNPDLIARFIQNLSKSIR